MSFWSFVSKVGSDIGDLLSPVYNLLQMFNKTPAVESLTTQVRTIVNGMINEIAKAVHTITVKIEEAKFHLSAALQQYYNTTTGFWVILLSAAAAIYATPAVLKWATTVLTQTKFYAQIMSLVSQVKSWTGWTYVNTLIEANRAAQILFTNWRIVWAGIYQDVGEISSDIGFGLGAVASAVTACKALLVTVNTTMGADEITAEADALQRMSSYLSGLSSDFNRYAENPQDIWNDLWEKVILPKQKEVMAYYSNLAGQINKINKDIQTLESLPAEFVTYQTDVQNALKVKLEGNNKIIEAQVLAQVKTSIEQYNSQIGDKIASFQSEVVSLNTAIIAHDKTIDANVQDLANLNDIIFMVFSGLNPVNTIQIYGNTLASQLLYMTSDEVKNDIGIFFYGLSLFSAAAMGTISDDEIGIFLNNPSEYIAAHTSGS